MVMSSGDKYRARGRSVKSGFNQGSGTGRHDSRYKRKDTKPVESKSFKRFKDAVDTGRLAPATIWATPAQWAVFAALGGTRWLRKLLDTEKENLEREENYKRAEAAKARQNDFDKIF